MFGMRASSIWRKLFDITYPFTALFTGHEFNRGIWKVFSESCIEDCWLPYFCVTTNITWSRMQIHQFGYMWRHIRASMTLAGYLPPMCEKGDLLVDGGYINNLPADVMKSLGANTIISVNVGSADDTSYGIFLLVIKIILNRCILIVLFIWTIRRRAGLCCSNE